MGIRGAALGIILVILGGCAAIAGPEVDAPDPGSPLAECRADSYAFAGRGTFAELGLVGRSAAELPEPDRPATIWVTRDLVPFDAAAPEGSRMLCFEFDDGSGGSHWPVDATWQPPGAAADPPASTNYAIAALLAAVLMLLVVGGLAFRRR